MHPNHRSLAHMSNVNARWPRIFPSPQSAFAFSPNRLPFPVVQSHPQPSHPSQSNLISPGLDSRSRPPTSHFSTPLSSPQLQPKLYHLTSNLPSSSHVGPLFPPISSNTLLSFDLNANPSNHFYRNESFKLNENEQTTHSLLNLSNNSSATNELLTVSVGQASLHQQQQQQQQQFQNAKPNQSSGHQPNVEQQVVAQGNATSSALQRLPSGRMFSRNHNGTSKSGRPSGEGKFLMIKSISLILPIKLIN